MNEQIIINMFEAGNGDSFLITCIEKSPVNILIDFGYSNTYKKYIERNLMSKKDKGEKLDLVIITHFDRDHISGALTFFENNENSKTPNIIEVGEVWHNSYRHLNVTQNKHQITEEEKEFIQKNSITIKKDYINGKRDISAIQGSRLAANLNYHNYQWNTSFNNKAVMYKYNNKIKLSAEVEIQVLSPTVLELERLRKVWKKELKRKFPEIELSEDEVFDDAIECISLMKKSKVPPLKKKIATTNNLKRLSAEEYDEDQDEINASSITCIIKFRNKKVLFLGDAPPSLIAEQLKKIYPHETNPIKFDAIKISHHGSRHNTTNSLLEVIDSEKFLISTNGRSYRHPHKETLAKIINRKNYGYRRNLYFTHQLPFIEDLNDDDMKNEYNYEIFYKDVNDDELKILV